MYYGWPTEPPQVSVHFSNARCIGAALYKTILFEIQFNDGAWAKNLIADGRFRRSDSVKSKVLLALSTA